MSSDWPEFPNKEPLADGRSWTAKFDSWNQRTDDCYYLVTLFDGEREVATFMVVIGTAFAGEGYDWDGPDFRNELRERIGQVATTGKANTDYRGPVMRL